MLSPHLGNSRPSYRSLKTDAKGVDGRVIGDGFAAVHESGYALSGYSHVPRRCPLSKGLCCKTPFDANREP
jgi:hypothetical protein